MARCDVCGREMLKARGCIGTQIIINRKRYDRIRMGAPKDFYRAIPDGRCGDCGALKGGLHHWGCDCERCPVCGGQLISCSCGDKEEIKLIIPYRAE